MTRIASYSTWKADLISAVVTTLSPPIQAFNESLVETFNAYQGNNMEIDLDQLYSALMKVIPNNTPVEELFELPDDFVNECKRAVDKLKEYGGLQPIWAEQDLSSMEWKCTIRLSSLEWQHAVERAIGCPIDLVIEAHMVDEEISISIPDLKFLEATDLLALRYTTDEYWRSPNTLLALQKQY